MSETDNKEGLIGSLAHLAQEIASPDLAAEDKVSSKSSKRKSKKGKSKNVTSAEMGCRTGYARHTYVLPIAQTDKVRNMAAYFGWTEAFTMEQIIAKGLADAIKKHGDKVVKPSSKPTLF